MRKTVWVAYVMFSLACAAPAQNKIHTKWRCPPPSGMHTLAVGDMPNHNFTIIQGSCSSTSTESVFAERESVYTEFQELRGTSVAVHGRMNVTMKNGDMVYYSYEGSFPADITRPFSQRWNLERGTGRYKSIQGKGNCSGMIHADGSGDMECVGTFSPGA